VVGIVSWNVDPIGTAIGVGNSCHAGFAKYGGNRPSFEGFLQCVDNLNPIAARRNDFTSSLSATNVAESGQAFGQGLLGSALVAAPFARGALGTSANCGPGASAESTGGSHVWTSWRNYPGVTEAGTQYAQIGERLWTQHAVDRMQPGGLGAPAGQIGAGRSIAPNFVQDVIRTGDTTQAIVNGVTRTIHTSGTVQVVTEQGGRIVVTVTPFYGG
jgi:hypothetical protein